MNSTTSVDARTLATVTVSFNPDIALLEIQLRALPAACTKFIVDNASQPELVAQIEALASRMENVRVLCNESNVGLAAAVNRGVEAASELVAPPRFVLLLDQDSEPQLGSIEGLITAFETLERAGEKVGCVGPLLRDRDTGLTHGFHQCTHWRWKRVYPSIGSMTPVRCANLNGSGTLVPVSLFRQLNGLDEQLFIDHVDTEWAFRVLASGYTVWGIPNAVFEHRMGQASMRFWWFGWRVWPSRSPQRHYFLARNAVVLMSSDYVPTVWKMWASMKLFIVLVVHLSFDHRRFEQAQGLISGIRDGLRARKRHRPARL